VKAKNGTTIIKKLTHNGRKVRIKEILLENGGILVGAYFERETKAIPGTEGRLSADEAQDAGWAKIKLAVLYENARTAAMRHGRV
jgi:hypothetical protein